MRTWSRERSHLWKAYSSQAVSPKREAGLRAKLTQEALPGQTSLELESADWQ